MRFYCHPTLLARRPPPLPKPTGLHAAHLTVATVTVDGAPVQWALVPPPPPPFAAAAPPGADALAAAAAGAAALHAAVVAAADAPTLVITLPPGVGTRLGGSGGGEGAALATPSKDGRTTSAGGGPTPAATPFSKVSAPTPPGGGGAGAPTPPTASAPPPPPPPPRVRAAVRVSFSVAAPNPRRGLRFWGDYAHTDGEPGCARHVFPTVDVDGAVFPLDARVTVGGGDTAIAPGALRRVRPSGRAGRRTFCYECALAMPASSLALAVGPFARHDLAAGDGDGAAARRARGARGASVSLFAPADAAPRLPFVADSLALALDAHEAYLGAPPPGGALHFVYLPPTGAPARLPHTGACVVLLSADALFGPRDGDAALEDRADAARAAAGAYFGVLTLPATPTDATLTAGLSRHLESLFLRSRLGTNEARWRAAVERDAVLAADDGAAPPLAPRAGDSSAVAATAPLDPSPLAPWKAAAVVAMLERRAGDDAFRRVLQRVVADAAAGAAAEAAVRRAPLPTDAAAAATFPPPALPDRRRRLTWPDFVADAARAGGFKKDAAPFVARYVDRAGALTVTAAAAFHRKRCVLEVALRQGGPAAGVRAAAAAEVAAPKEGTSVGLVRVAIREAAGGVADHPVHVGASRLTLAELRVTPPLKKAAKAPGRKRRATSADAGDEGDDGEGSPPRPAAQLDDDDDDGAPPVWWFRLDPTGEMLAATRVLQPASAWARALDRSGDAATQREAVAALASARRPLPPYAVNVLAACLDNSALHCRVRAAAATALGGADAGDGAASRLLRFVSSALRDDGGRPRAWRCLAADPGDAAVLAAAVTSLARVRVAGGASPREVVDEVVSLARRARVGGGGPLTGDTLAAASVRALGDLRPPDAEAAAAVAAALASRLARDGAAPSHRLALTRAALGAAASLVAAGPSGGDALPALLGGAVASHAAADAPPAARGAARAAAVRASAALSGPDAGVDAALTALDADPSPTVRRTTLEALLAALQAGAGAGWRTADGARARRRRPRASPACSPSSPPPPPPKPTSPSCVCAWRVAPPPPCGGTPPRGTRRTCGPLRPRPPRVARPRRRLQKARPPVAPASSFA